MSEIKTFFRSIRDKRQQVREIRRQLEEGYASLLPKGIQYDKIAVQSSGSTDPMADAFASIQKIEARYARMMRRYQADVDLATNIVEQMEVPRESRLLTLYYIRPEPMTWEEVAKEMGYEIAQVYRIHGRALQHAEPIYKAMRAKMIENDS